MPLEILYKEPNLREYYERMLLEDARSDLKAQSIIDIEYNRIMQLIIFCDLNELPYHAEPNKPELSGYYIQTNHIKYIFIAKNATKDAVLASEMAWKKNIIYCPILNHPSTPEYKITDQEISTLNDKEYKRHFYHEIQHILDKYRFKDKAALSRIPDEFSSTKAYHNYSPEMNGHVAEILAQVKGEVLHILQYINNLDNLEKIRERYQKNFKCVLTDLHNNQDTTLYDQLNLKKSFVSDLTESHFYRLLQRVRAIVDKLFDDKKEELKQGE